MAFILHYFTEIGILGTTSQCFKLDPYCLQHKCGPKNPMLAMYNLSRYSQKLLRKIR